MLISNNFNISHVYKKHFDTIKNDSEFRRLIYALIDYIHNSKLPKNLETSSAIIFGSIKRDIDDEFDNTYKNNSPKVRDCKLSQSERAKRQEEARKQLDKIQEQQFKHKS